jgi:hypothetical protein
MATWYSTKLPGGLRGALEIVRLQKILLSETAALKSGFEAGAQNLAVFCHHDTMYLAWTVYFPPEVAPLAQRHNAQPCEKPPRRGLNLIVGSRHCWNYFYPRSPSRSRFG